MSVLNEKLKNDDYVRFLKMFESEDPKYCFGGISACRGLAKENPTKKDIDDNNHRNNQASQLLEHEINAAGLSFMEMKGVYEEFEAGTVYEKSFLIYTTKEDLLREVLETLGRAFNQDSVLFIKDKKAQFIWTGEYEQPDWAKGTFKVDFNQNSLETMFSRLGTKSAGRRFQLSSIEEKKFANNFMTKLMYYTSDDIIKVNKLNESSYKDDFVSGVRKYLETLDCSSTEQAVE